MHTTPIHPLSWRPPLTRFSPSNSTMMRNSMAKTGQPLKWSCWLKEILEDSSTTGKTWSQSLVLHLQHYQLHPSIVLEYDQRESIALASIIRNVKEIFGVGINPHKPSHMAWTRERRIQCGSLHGCVVAWSMAAWLHGCQRGWYIAALLSKVDQVHQTWWESTHSVNFCCFFA